MPHLLNWGNHTCYICSPFPPLMIESPSHFSWVPVAMSQRPHFPASFGIWLEIGAMVASWVRVALKCVIPRVRQSAACILLESLFSPTPVTLETGCSKWQGYKTQEPRLLRHPLSQPYRWDALDWEWEMSPFHVKLNHWDFKVFPQGQSVLITWIQA